MTDRDVYVNPDGYATSWGRDDDERWNTFRALVQAGTDPDTAAHQAGVPPAAPTVGDTVRVYHRSFDGSTGERTRVRQHGEYVIVRENRHGDWTVRCPLGTTHDVFRDDVEHIR